METVYTVCAVVGGTILVCQVLMSLLGLGGEHDFGGHDVGHDFHVGDSHVGDTHHGDGHADDHDHGTSRFLSLLSFRTVVAALTFFGLAGRAGEAHWGDEPLTLIVALAAAAGAVMLVAWLMQSLRKLHSEGNVRIERAVGQSGTVYLTVPGQRAGAGKVTLNLQNRTVEYQAVTAQNEQLPTGARVIVVSVVSPDTVEVLPVTDSERTTHA